jgi:large subunit ribosomal protein L9
MQRKRALQAAADKSDAEEAVARLEGLVLQVTAKASEEGRLFGSVGVGEVVSALVDQFGLEVGRGQVSGDPVKDLGTHGFTVRLHPEVDLQVSVEVLAEG